MASNKVLDFIIGVKDQASQKIASLKERIASFAKGVGTNLMNIKAGFDMAIGAVRKFAGVFAKAIGEAFKFEKMTSDFKVLLGSIDQAKAHLAELREFGAKTPLSFEDLAKASKLLLSFGSSVDEVMPSLKTLGDIAMGDAQKFQGLALVFAQVKSQGKLMGQDLLQMINQGFNPLTIIAQETGKSMGELKELMGEGAISFDMVAEAMRIVTSEGGLFNNAMDEASKTGEGMVSTLQDNWTEAVRTFGEAFSDAAKNGVETLSEKIQRLTEDGSIKRWAEESCEALTHVINGFNFIGKIINGIYKYSGAQDLWNLAQGSFRGVGDSIGAFAGTLQGGGGVWDAVKAGANGLWQGIVDEMDDDAFYWKKFSPNLNISDPLPNKLKTTNKPKVTDKPKTTENPKTLKNMFEDAMREQELLKAIEEKEKRLKEIDEEEKWAKAIEAEEEKRFKAMEKAVKAEEEERLRIEKIIAQERERLLKEEMEAYQRDLTKAHQEAVEKEAFARERLAAAEARERQAWGWYRDRDSWKAQLAEERAEAQAQKQFELDFKSLKNRHYNWRSAKLNDDDELIKRVALAKEEKAKAEEYAKITAEATKGAAERLEQIESYFAQGGE